jgi:beta-aspartyl-peptidase (threonine type)
LRIVIIRGFAAPEALAPDGQLAWSFNTPGIFRARQKEGSKLEIGIYCDEP